MVLELKLRNKKSVLLDTTKKQISDKMVEKMISRVLELEGKDINNYDRDTIDATIKSVKRDSIIKYNSIEFVVTGNKDNDYIKLKGKYQGAVLYNNDYVIIYD